MKLTLMKVLILTLLISANYKLKREDRGVGNRGGCGFIISDKVAYTEITMNTNLTKIEVKWIKIKSSNIFLCGFYRSSGYCKLDNFLGYFTECMNKLKGKKALWIGG